MASITLEVGKDLAAALTVYSKNLNISAEELSQTVLEQWFLDQAQPEQCPWSDDDLAAIEDGQAQARRGETLSHFDVRTHLLSKAG